MPAIALALAITSVLAACTASAPALTDPKAIISQGMKATSQATSFHVDVQVTGTVNLQDTGGTFNLTGTTAAGDFDLPNKLAHLTFSAPGLMGLTGDVIQIGNDSYVKTSLTGTTYTKSTTSAAEGVKTDPDALFTQVTSFLDKEGVETAKLDDVDCGDAKCYAVTLTVPTSQLGVPGTTDGVDVRQFLADGLKLNLQFDRSTLRLTSASTDIDAGTLGTFGLSLTVSKYNESVQVSPPPSDQVTTGGNPLGL
ncbi:MAG TPA: hypothetical protein VF153_06955 [Candidatus Limnocylindria bacterium]